MFVRFVRKARVTNLFEGKPHAAPPIEITSRRGDAVLPSRADYDALEETAHLLRAPANAWRLIESLQQAVAGKREEHDLAR